MYFLQNTLCLVLILASSRADDKVTPVNMDVAQAGIKELLNEEHANLSADGTLYHEEFFTTNDNDNEAPSYEDDTYGLSVDPHRSNSDDIADQKHNKSRVNGGQVVSQIVPYQVSMQLFRRGKWNHFCGGSIISPHHVLTAAHCVDKFKVEDINVVGGTLTWKTGGDRHKVLAKRVHPSFSMSPKIINDIAIVKVSPPLNLHKSSIGAIGLGGSSRIGDKVSVRLTGWGSITPTGSSGLPEQLQMLNYRTISNEECGAKGFKVTQNEMCALAAMGRGACVGDSGGPLVTPHGVPQLVGIVSYGTATCAQGRPDVYTRVSSFLPYINKVITNEIP